jgi:hypothetical protein
MLRHWPYSFSTPMTLLDWASIYREQPWKHGSHAETDLRNIKYTNDQDFKELISCIHTQWSNANAISAKIVDTSFRTIILAALSHSWDPIIAILYITPPALMKRSTI